MLDMKMDGDTPVENLDPEIISSLFKQAQENGQPEEVVQLAEMLAKNNVKLDRFHQVSALSPSRYRVSYDAPFLNGLVEGHIPAALTASPSGASPPCSHIAACTC